MLKFLTLLPVLALGFIAPAVAQEIDAQTDLMLRCGAGYLLLADREDFDGTEEDKATLIGFGNYLITRADETLAAAGMPEAQRASLGYQVMAEIDGAFESGAETGLNADACMAFLEAEQADADATTAARDQQIDMLMTCGAGFYASARELRDAGETADADLLEQLGLAQVEAAENLMIEAGMGEDARFQLSKLYGEQVGTKLQNGEDLAYDWDTCASLEY